MNNALTGHFTYGRLMRYTLPTVAMLICTSIYYVVDGFFVSNFVGKTALAAVNLVMPPVMIIQSLGFMFGTGTSALISHIRGGGDPERARRILSLMVYTLLIAGTGLTILALILLRPVSAHFGVEGQLLEDCVDYGFIVLLCTPLAMLQYAFEVIYSAAEQPRLGLYMAVLCGVLNIGLDAIFIVGFEWDLIGAAVATAISAAIGGLVPLIYFARPNPSPYQLGRTTLDLRALWRICLNGSSEFVTDVSMSLVAILYNYQLLRYIGENGVAAYGVLMYLGLCFVGIFVGFTTGCAPIVSFHHGAGDAAEVKSILRKSTCIILVASLIMFALAQLCKWPLAQFFVGYDPELCELTAHALSVVAFSFLFSGLAIFTSGFFTALNDGVTSAVIALMRTMGFEVAGILLLPPLLGVDGIWLAFVVAEIMGLALALCCLYLKRHRLMEKAISGF